MKQFYQLFFFAALLLVTPSAFSQRVGIGTNAPNPAAKLDISDTTMGLLVPRLTTAQRNNINTPPAGLWIYNKSQNLFNYYNGTVWVALDTSFAAGIASGGAWNLTGNSGTNSSAHFIGTADNHPLVIKVNNAFAGYIDSTGGNSNTTWGVSTMTPFAGNANTAFGQQALVSNTTGSKNSGLGALADVGNNNLSNATAIGANARVDSSNTIVLGSVAGINGATANVKVGIGTTTPSRPLEIATGQLRMSNALGDIEYTEVADLVGWVTTLSPNPTLPVFRVHSGPALTHLLDLLNNGNLGLGGVPSPVNKLDVKGNLALGTYAGVVTAPTNGAIIPGNVGVGTPSPTLATLQVHGMVGNTTALFRGTAANSWGTAIVSDWPGIYFNSYYNGTFRQMASTGYAAWINSNQINGGITISATPIANTSAGSNITSYIDVMSITGNGRVGIRTPTPNAILDVTGAVEADTVRIPTNAGAGKVLTSDATGNGLWQTPAPVTAGWSLTGNSGTDPALNFIGTTDNQTLIFKVSGQQAGRIDSIGGGLNTAFGRLAAFALTTGTENTALGKSALLSLHTGSDNTAIGVGALGGNISGNNNVAIGAYASASYTGSGSLAIGDSALFSNTATAGSIAIGNRAGRSNTTGVRNFFIGDQAGYSNTTGEYGFFFGNSAGYSNTTGYANYFIGENSGRANTTGQLNLCIGGSSALLNTTGSYNYVFGDFGLSSNDTSNYNSAWGRYALGNHLTGDHNMAFGWQAMFVNNTGAFNTVFGDQALNTAGTVYNTVAIGYRSLYSQSGANRANLAIGAAAAYNVTTGSGNALIGDSVAFNTLSGSDNTALGYHTLMGNVAGDKNTAIGYKADVASGSLTNATAIGALARADRSNSLILGSINGINGATANTNVGIGTGSPKSRLEVNGSFATNTTVTSANITLTDLHASVFCNAAISSITVTLPSASGIDGRIYTIKKVDKSAHTVTIDAAGAETIDGNNNLIFSAGYKYVVIQSDGSNWMVIGGN